MTIIISENFDSSTAGMLPSGWTAGSGTWAIETAAFVSSPNGLSSATGDGSTIFYTGLGALADMEMRFDFNPHASNSCMAAMVRSTSDGQTGYIGGPTDATNLNSQWHIVKRIAGVFTSLVNFSVPALSGNISVRMRVQGSTLSLNVWPAGTVEPSGWIGQTTDSSISAPGFAGIYNQGGVATSGADNFTLDNLITPIVSVAPSTVLASSTGNSLTLTGTATSWTAGTPGAPSFTVSDGSITAQVIHSATSATLTYSAPSSSGSVTIADPSSGVTTLLTVNSVATDFSITPGSNSTTAGNATSVYTIHANGTPSSPVTISLGDGGASGTFKDSVGSTITSLTFSDDGAHAFSYTPALFASPGSIPLTGTAMGGLATEHEVNCDVVSGPARISVDDPNWFFSPYNWYLDGPNEAVAHAPGAYMKIGFTGTSAVLGVQVSQVPGNLPKIRWSIDGGPYQIAQLSGTTVGLASDLASGNHTLWLQYMAADGGSGWSTLTNVFWITGLTLDSGATSVAPLLKTKRVLFNGDSGAQGVRATGGSAGVSGDDSLVSYASYCLRAMDAEYGLLGFTGLGWTVAAAGGAGPVAFFTPGNDTNSSWNKYWAGHTRLVNGRYDPPPDYIITCLGANDWNVSAPNVEASVIAYLTAARAAAPNTWLFIVVAINGIQRAAVQAGFNSYQASTPDANAVLIDIDADTLYNLSTETGGAVAMAGTPDGAHSDYTLGGVIGGMIGNKIQRALDVQGNNPGGATYPRSRIVNE